jgi:hypothetical protein
MYVFRNSEGRYAKVFWIIHIGSLLVCHNCIIYWCWICCSMTIVLLLLSKYMVIRKKSNQDLDRWTKTLSHDSAQERGLTPAQEHNHIAHQLSLPLFMLMAERSTGLHRHLIGNAIQLILLFRWIWNSLFLYHIWTLCRSAYWSDNGSLEKIMIIWQKYCLEANNIFRKEVHE